MWVRGLKLITTGYEPKPHCVAPRVGAWIETRYSNDPQYIHIKSHPVWVRGLKQVIDKREDVINGGRTPCGCVD